MKSSLPSYQIGQTIQTQVVSIREIETTPPRRFTEGTLISAMTHIHQFVNNEEDRKILQNAKGIGTERTRDAIIETLKQREYIVCSKKGELQPTALGTELIQKLPLELSDPGMTAKWELALGLVEQGRMKQQQFDIMIRDMTTKLIESMKTIKLDTDKLGLPLNKRRMRS